MIVVADTSPLNYLVRLQRIDLLQLLYGRVIVPDAVIKELRHAGAPAAVRNWAAVLPSWLEVRAVSSLDETLPPGLGSGERQAISLALELRAETLLIDELMADNKPKLDSLPLQVRWPCSCGQPWATTWTFPTNLETCDLSDSEWVSPWRAIPWPSTIDCGNNIPLSCTPASNGFPLDNA